MLSSTSMHVHSIIYFFSINSVYGLNQILEYKNVHDIPIYMFYSFFCLCVYLHIHKQNSCRAMKDTVNNTRCKFPWPSGSCVTFESAHLFNTTCNWEGVFCLAFFICLFFFFFFFFLTGRSRNEMSPLSIGESYMDVVKLIPALTRASRLTKWF